MSSAHILLLLGSQNHMRNAPSRLSAAWWFVYRGTQGLYVNSEPGTPTPDFSETRSCDDTIDMDYSKKKKKKIFKPARDESVAPDGVETKALILDTGFAFLTGSVLGYCR